MKIYYPVQPPILSQVAESIIINIMNEQPRNIPAKSLKLDQSLACFPVTLLKSSFSRTVSINPPTRETIKYI